MVGFSQRTDILYSTFPCVGKSILSSSTRRSGDVPRVPRRDSSQPSGSELRQVSGKVHHTRTTIPERTKAVIRGITLLMRHHGCHSKIIISAEKQIRAYANSSSSEKVWMKRMKYLLSYPIAKYLRNELPPTPDVEFKPSGVLRSFFKSRLLSFNKKNTHFWYSWYQAKRSSLPVSDDMVEGAYDDHLVALTSPDPGDEAVIDDIFSDTTFQYVLGKIKKHLSKVVKSEDFLNYVPKGSASFESTRKDGGQFRYLSSIAFEKSDESTFLGIPELNKIDDEGEIKIPSGLDDWSSLGSLSSKLQEDTLSCTIQAVLEPMKIRIISKGESLPYYSMKALQKELHSYMRKMSCFRLIGRPFCPTDMMDLKKESHPDWEWFSIDYSAATDGLSYQYSRQIMEEIFELIPPSMYKRAFSVLGMHDLYYPTVEVEPMSGRKTFSRDLRGTMTNGQLMGSILSFPILCLANLGVYLKVTRDIQKKWTKKQRLNHTLINGDDMLYAAPKKLWEDHVRIGRSVGLQMSPGKAYVHDTYANVNSVSIHHSLKKANSTPYLIPFLNVGLFYGQHKVQGERGVEDESLRPDSFVQCIDEVLKGCFRNRQIMLYNYLSLHKDKINEETKSTLNIRGHKTIFHRNIFLPCSVGGCGIQIPPRELDRNRSRVEKTPVYLGYNLKVKKVHKIVAAKYYHTRPSGCEPDFQRPFKGSDPKVPILPMVAHRRTTEYEYTMPEFSTREHSLPKEKFNDQIHAHCWKTLGIHFYEPPKKLRCRVPMGQYLANLINKSSSEQVGYHNEILDAYSSNNLSYFTKKSYDFEPLDGSNYDIDVSK